MSMHGGCRKTDGGIGWWFGGGYVDGGGESDGRDNVRARLLLRQQKGGETAVSDNAVCAASAVWQGAGRAAFIDWWSDVTRAGE